MIGIYLTVPIACFRKGMAREFLETEQIPPPATCYGFLLSLVGETNRQRHIGCRVAPAMLSQPDMSLVLRTVWRVKSKPLGSAGNARPDFQQLLTGIELLIWLDSSEEVHIEGNNLEARVCEALESPSAVTRFGGLSLGESSHMVNDVFLLDDRRKDLLDQRSPLVFLLNENGRLTLPVWVDHVGSKRTSFATGNLQQGQLIAPNIKLMPAIRPLSN